jgi:hypothetical protein
LIIFPLSISIEVSAVRTIAFTILSIFYKLVREWKYSCKNRHFWQKSARLPSKNGISINLRKMEN